MDTSGNDLDLKFRLSLEAHVLRLDAGGHAEALPADVRRRACAGGTKEDLAGIGVRIGDELLHRF